MRLGYASMNTLEDPRPDELAGALEDRGYESVWFGEHSHIPCSRLTPYPAGGELPRQYTRMMDLFVSLTAAAAVTTTLRLGAGVALPLEHDVLVLAKTVATLDRLSGGRVLFGVGVGWNREELANHRDVPWSQRYRAVAECVEVLRRLWDDPTPEFHGRYYDFDPLWSEPKPLQRPHPPILCGMAGRLGTAQATAWADGWLPLEVALGDVAKKVGRFRDAVRAAGRGDLPITIMTWGDPTPDRLRAYRDLGIERVVLGLAGEASDDPGAVMPFLDRYAPLTAELA